MATNIANLSVLLTAKTDPFGKGMKKAQKELSAFAGSVVSASANLIKYTAVAVAAAAAATAVFVKKSMTAIDSTAKLSDRLGIATEDLLGLRYAADLAGGGAEALDDALEKFSKGIGDPSTEFLEGLNKIGLSTAALLGQDPARNFGLMADGINKLGTQEEKAAVMVDLFGKSNTELMTTIALGSKGFAAHREELVKLGGAYSRDGARKVEEANDAFTRLHTIFNGIIQQLAIEISPFLSTFVEKITKAASESGGLGSVVARTMQTIVNAIDDAINSVKGFGAELKRTGSVALRTLADIYSLGGFIETDRTKAARAWADKIDTDVGTARAQSGMAKPGSAITDAYNKVQVEAGNQAKIAGILAGIEKMIQKSEQKDKDRAYVRGTIKGAMTSAQDFIQRARGLNNIVGYASQAKGWVNSQLERANKIAMRQPASQITGTRGTFSGETAGRMQATYSVSVQQLQEAKRQSDLLQLIVDGVKGGAVVG